MKKLISLILTVFVLLTSLIQVNVFAENDSGLQNALKAAKSKFEIPAGLSEFNYSIGTEGDKKVWSLDWSSKEGDGHIRVSVDEKGNIVHYDNDKPTMTQYKRKLPKVSRQDAKIMADDFIAKMDASLPGQIKYIENTQSLDMGNLYYLNYTRTVNGIAFPENYIQININAETGEIQNYNRYWTDDLNFPDKGKTINLDDAKSSFKEKLGMVLSYAYRMEDKKVKTFLMYSPKDTNSFIDAITGEKITLNNPVMVGGGADFAAVAKDVKFDKDGGQISYTPDEIKAISEASSIISKEDIEKRIRALKVLGLSDKYAVTSVSLDKYGIDNENLTWNFNFMEDGKDKKEVTPGIVSVSADAKTGEIKSFWIGAPRQDAGTAKYDKVFSKATVEEFLKEIQPDKFKETAYKESPEQIVVPYMEKENLRDYNFNYVRMVNGIEFPANSLSVGFNAVSGKITSYSSSWFNTAFENKDKVIPIDKIYDKLFNEIGLELLYRSNYPNRYYPGTAGKKPEIKLVYSIKPEKPASFDADSGIIINSDGKPYKDNKPLEYKDIKGHYAEKQIKILREYGISLDGDELRPDSDILQKDFVKLLASVLNYVPTLPQPIDSKNQSVMTEEMYKVLIREGIMKAEEKAPDAVVTREDSVKFLIRALKYDKVAEVKGIFNCSFKDKDKINPDLVGYVVIADGLNIIKGSNGMFNPKKALTRAQAIIEAYNYLQI